MWSDTATVSESALVTAPHPKYETLADWLAHWARCPAPVSYTHLDVYKRQQLTSLYLWRCSNPTDAGLAHVAQPTQLTSLSFSECWNLTDDGLAHVAQLTQLTSLNLSWCKNLTDAGLAHVAQLTQLTSLNLSYSEDLITGAGLAQLRLLQGLVELETLSLIHI